MIGHRVCEPLTRYRKRRTWETTGNQVDAFVWSCVEVSDIFLNHMPVRSVLPESGARVPVDLN